MSVLLGDGAVTQNRLFDGFQRVQRGYLVLPKASGLADWVRTMSGAFGLLSEGRVIFPCPYCGEHPIVGQATLLSDELTAFTDSQPKVVRIESPRFLIRGRPAFVVTYFDLPFDVFAAPLLIEIV